MNTIRERLQRNAEDCDKNVIKEHFLSKEELYRAIRLLNYRRSNNPFGYADGTDLRLLACSQQDVKKYPDATYIASFLAVRKGMMPEVFKREDGTLVRTGRVISMYERTFHHYYAY